MKRIYNKYQKLIGADQNFAICDINVQVTGQTASDIIRQRLLQDQPVMISRYGATELAVILNALFIRKNLFVQAFNLARGIPYFATLKKSLLHDLNVVAGFFPITPKHIDRF